MVVLRKKLPGHVAERVQASREPDKTPEQPPSSNELPKAGDVPNSTKDEKTVIEKTKELTIQTTLQSSETGPAVPGYLDYLDAKYHDTE